jgi:hypothetical protein
MLRFATAVPVISLLACGLAHADPIASEARTVPAFHAIDLSGVLDVNVTVGKPASVEIFGDADMLAKVTTTVENGVLVVGTKKKLRKNSHLKAVVTAPDLTSLALSGVGDLKATGISNDRLAIHLSGVGSLGAEGTTGTLSVVHSGTGDVAAKNLAAKASTVEITGVGDAVVQATQSIDARLTGVGDIKVYGHPAQVKKSRSGIGDIKIH